MNIVELCCGDRVLITHDNITEVAVIKDIGEDGIILVRDTSHKFFEIKSHNVVKIFG